MSAKNSAIELRHNQMARYWAMALVVFCAVGLSTGIINFGPFWKGYVLDITGPAWNYILFRGLFTSYKFNWWTRFFTPIRTFTIFVLVAFGIEIMQLLEVYQSTFDPWDFFAYVSILLPLFLLDLRQSSVQHAD